MAVAAAGTDGGGSIRLPAAYCGCVGLKPTNGRIGSTGVVHLDYSVATSGPIAGAPCPCPSALPSTTHHPPNHLGEVMHGALGKQRCLAQSQRGTLDAAAAFAVEAVRSAGCLAAAANAIMQVESCRCVLGGTADVLHCCYKGLLLGRC